MLTRRATVAILLISALFASGLFQFLFFAGPADAKSPDYRQLRLFREVMGIVKKNYVKQTTDKELINGAINGMLQSLDPYSSYLTEEMYKELQVETRGEFSGLGIEITLEDGILTIVSPIEDTPAFRAGLQQGDKIVKIEGETTKNITLLEAVKKMRGKRGTKVTLTIMREGFTKFKDFTIVRDTIHVESVRKQKLEKGIPYVRIVNFQENTANDLRKSIKDFRKQGDIKGLVLDLRNNPGGLLDQAVEVANLFVDKGLIVYTDGRVKEQQMEFRATRSSNRYEFKLAVLINEGSASASEIVAGCLQDHDRALILGIKSFGKASVQTIIRLDDGGGLRLTTAYYYTPKGRNIQKKGILPDVNLKEDIEEEREARRKKEEDSDEKVKSLIRRRTVDPKTDVALSKAINWIKSDVSVQDFKEDLKKNVKETAWYMD
jgi:carboxyl-terminal processing protease